MSHWTTEIPTREGWYWIKWNETRNGESDTRMWYFDGSNEDIGALKARAKQFYGPLEPPEDNE